MYDAELNNLKKAREGEKLLFSIGRKYNKWRNRA